MGEMESCDAKIPPSFSKFICNKKFSRRTNVKRHIATVHASKEVFNCDECDFMAQSERTLTLHIKSIHFERKVNCHICDKTVLIRYLNTHIKLTHETFSHTCPECKKEFNSDIYLKKHFSRMHEGRVSFNCDICDFQSNSEENLNDHRMRIHDVLDKKEKGKTRKY